MGNLILYVVNSKSFISISDTLIKDYNRSIPLKYATKVFVIPHLKCFIFGIGVFEFTKLYYNNLLNVITDNFEYIIKISEKVCLDLYNHLELNKNKVFTKVFLACQDKDKIYLVSFSSDSNFTPNIIKEAFGFYPNNETIQKQISLEIAKEKIDINSIVDIIKKNEKLLDCSGEYFLHMFIEENGFIIKKVGISEDYNINLKSMLRYCNAPPERKGISVYFDQNIWGELVDDIEKNRLERLEILIKGINEGKINLTYSSVNIHETVRRKINKKVKQELSLMKRLTYNYYIDETYAFKIKDPFDAYQEVNTIDPVVQTLIDNFKDNIKELIDAETKTDIKQKICESKIMNNIYTEKIFDKLDE